VLQSLAGPPKPLPRSILKQPIQPLPELPPYKPKNDSKSAPTGSPDDNTDGSAAAGTKIALKTEEEQQAAAREREERERAQLEKEEKDRREARRKSLANRRVSFAAEATLHMWDVIEPGEHDSTTSTDRNRRASSAPQQPSSDPSEPPSTPPAAVIEDPIDLADDQREAHQKKNRRSSGIPSMNFNNPHDYTNSSTIYSSDSEHADGVAEIQGEEMSDSDSEMEDGTMMTVEADEMTSASVTGVRPEYEQEDSGSLDENLRVASQRASTRRLETDDSDDEEAIPAFGWVKKNTVAPQPVSEVTAKMMDAVQRSPEKEDDEMSSEMEMDVDEDMEMEMTHAVGGILRSNKPPTPSPQKDEEEEMDMDMDMSMDVTKVLGGIIAMGKPSTRRQSVRPPPRQPTPEEEDDDGGATMEFTMAVGGIKAAAGRTSGGSTDLEGNEDMSMEITTAIGAVLPNTRGQGKSPAQNRRRSMATRHRPADEDDEDGAMDMTTAVGRILPTVHKEDEEEDDETVGMDMTMGMEMTTAIGGIIKPAAKPQDRQAAKKAMEEEADEPGLPQLAVDLKPGTPKQHVQTIADETGSPALSAFRGKGLRRSSVRAGATTPKSATPRTTKPDNLTTPKTVTPSKTQTKTAVPAAATPTRTPSPPKMIGSRSSSPKRPKSPANTTTPRSATKSRPSLFHQNPETGATTPRVILSPNRRRLSGVGIDRPGLGSPRISEILDRRESIGDASASFSPIPVDFPRKGVSFADPRAMVAELDRERKEEEDRENARTVLEREADGDLTASLRDMISSLSPVKPPRPQFKGRKSLAVGSGKGLLGKRPIELDEDDEDERQDGVKRLKGLQGSPVKNVRLGSPPSKEETTTGRRTRASAREDTTTPTINLSPKKVGSPETTGRFRSVDDEPTTTFNLDHTVSVTEAEVEREADEDRIHLQDFLNMTSIRFMELTTTKRRHTIAPAQPRDSAVVDGKEEMSLERCVVAGACTVPMLELFQHVSLPPSSNRLYIC
jgi:kinetochore protein Spc7/SPC105